MATSTLNNEDRINRGLRLQAIRGMLNLSIKEFAQKCGVGESTFSQWESGKFNSLSEKGARTITEFIEKDGTIFCSIDWLLHGEGVPPFFKSNNYNIAKRQQQLLSESKDQNLSDEALLKQEIEQFKLRSNAVVTQVFDDSMEPLFVSGDYVGGVYLQNGTLHKGLGKICIIQTDDEKLLFRKLLRDENEPTKYKLCCVNANTLSAKSVISGVIVIKAAPVTRLWRLNM